MTQAESKRERSSICVGLSDNAIWTDGTGIAACGSREQHKPHRFTYTPADSPRIVAECRVCDWTGSEQAALDHFESTDHDCDVQEVKP